MRSSVNLTGRQDILRENIDAEVFTENSTSSLSLKWDLTGLSLPSDSEIFVFLWAAGTFESMSIEIGRLSERSENEFKADVSQMRNLDKLRLRMVVRHLVDGVPMIVAQVDQVRVINKNGDDQVNSLLHVVPDPSLVVPWEVRFEEGIPEVFIKEENGLYSFLKSETDWFWPTLLSDILGKIFDWYFTSDEDVEKDSEYQEKWGSFFLDLGCSLNLIQLARMEPKDIASEDLKVERKRALDQFTRRSGFMESLSSLMELKEGNE
jgi:hypothetical protein